MKITKFTHACLLVESKDFVTLVDPGKFSWDAEKFNVNNLSRLDTIVITHEHDDHFYLPFVRAVLARFPDAKIVTTPGVVAQLQQAGIVAASQSVNDVVVFSTKPHAALDPLGQAPENIAVHIGDWLTVGGDRHDLEESKAILALTVTAPWGSMLGAVRMAVGLKPKQIIPVHDWHWNDTARAGAYSGLTGFFADMGVTFHSPVDGAPIEISI